MQVSKYIFAIVLVATMLTLSTLSNNTLQFVNAQQASLSVSAAETGGKFFGPQIVQVVIDGPGIRNPDTSPGSLQVNGVNVPLVHLADSRWYAFFADEDTFTTLAAAANFPGQSISALGGDFWVISPNGRQLLFPTLPSAFANDPTNNLINPNLDLSGDCPASFTDSNPCVEWPYIRLFGFTENDQVSIRFGTQSVTLNYIEPSLDDVSLSLDRNAYPVNAEIIFGLTDYMWNINPVEEDLVHFAFVDGNTEVFYQASRSLAPAELSGLFFNLNFDSKQILQIDGRSNVELKSVKDGKPATVMIEVFPNSAKFENIDDMKGGRSDIIAKVRDSVVTFNYFDRSISASIARGSASVSIGKEEPKIVTPPPPPVMEKATIIEPYSISEPELLDVFGNPISQVDSGVPVLIQTTVTNNLDEEQPFAYILKVKDTNGFTVMLTWIKGVMRANVSLDAGISWTPENIGEYAIELFVWKSTDEPGILPASKKMTVSIA